MATVVLGAGVIGVTAAWYLAKAGHQVVVVERNGAAGLETSFGNGGLLHASEAEPWSRPGTPLKLLRWIGREDAPLLLRYSALPDMWRWGLRFSANCRHDRFIATTISNLALAMESLAAIDAIVAETGIQYDRLRRGILKIYRSTGNLEAALRHVDSLAPHGLVFRQLTAEECVALEPALADTRRTLVGGILFERDEVGDCNRFTQGLAAAAARAGVDLRFGTSVRRLDIGGGRIRGVETDNGRIDADRVVVAMGSFTAPLLRTVGIALPIYPVKGISVTFDRGGWNGAPKIAMIDDEAMLGISSIGDRIRIAGSAEIAGYDPRPSMTRARAMVRRAIGSLPAMAPYLDLDKAEVWAGLRPVSANGRPIIGPTSIAGLWVSSGHGHLGWTLACGSARRLASLMGDPCRQHV